MTDTFAEVAFVDDPSFEVVHGCEIFMFRNMYEELLRGDDATAGLSPAWSQIVQFFRIFDLLFVRQSLSSDDFALTMLSWLLELHGGLKRTILFKYVSASSNSIFQARVTILTIANNTCAIPV